MILMDKAKENPSKKPQILDQLLYEADYMAKNSLCPLGQSPILPIKSLKQYFQHQF
jgi:NADH:ubiquinone oxidoreductase subunit F (NADH-binding)